MEQKPPQNRIFISRDTGGIASFKNNIVWLCVHNFGFMQILDPIFSVSSPVVCATGTAQVGEGLVNSWGLEEDEDEGDESQMTEDRKTGSVFCTFLYYLGFGQFDGNFWLCSIVFFL